MSWLLIAILAPALWAAVNHIDKYLLSKYFKGGGIGTLLLFMSFASIIVLPGIFFFHPAVLNISFYQIIILLGVSLVYLLYLFFYFYALDRDEASLVGPLFQTVPIFSYFLGYVILHETLTTKQLLACGLIIIGAIIISLDLSQKKMVLKKTIFLAMMLSSFCLAMTGVIFKSVALQTDFLTTTFWIYIGQVLFAICLFSLVKKYREQFLQALKKNKVTILSINVLNELLNIGADTAIRLAAMLAPVALVTTVEGFQPFFILIYALIISRFFPRFETEKITRKDLIQKIIAILIMFSGSLFLNA